MANRRANGHSTSSYGSLFGGNETLTSGISDSFSKSSSYNSNGSYFTYSSSSNDNNNGYQYPTSTAREAASNASSHKANFATPCSAGTSHNKSSYKTAYNTAASYGNPEAYRSSTGGGGGAESSSSSSYMSLREIVSSIAQINDHLYLSSLHAIDASKLMQLNVTLVVSAMTDSPPRFPGVAETLHIPVEDVEHASLAPYFDKVASRIHSERAKGKASLVHCMAGISRSSSLVLAYLMKYENMNLRQAFLHVRSTRSCVLPNIGFWRQLLNYEEKLFGCKSVKIITTGPGAPYADVAGRGSGASAVAAGSSSGKTKKKGFFSSGKSSNIGSLLSRLQWG